MAKNKYHKLSLPKETLWVIDIIMSCETARQMEICEKLKQNYEAMFKDEHMVHINEAFDEKALATNYWQHKALLHKEKFPLVHKSGK